MIDTIDSPPQPLSPNPIAVVVPAAGLGTRMRPRSQARGKEMMELGGLPLIEGAIRELLAAGQPPSAFVVAPDKPALRDWIEARTSDWPTPPQLVVQPEPLGIVDAVMTARAALGVERSAVLYPDYVALPDQTALALLLKASRAAAGSWFGLVRRTPEVAARFGRTARVRTRPGPGGHHRVVAVEACSEPADGSLHTCFAEIRCARHVGELEVAPPDDSRTLAVLNELAGAGAMFGVELPGFILDAGIPAGYDDACARFSAGARWRRLRGER